MTVWAYQSLRKPALPTGGLRYGVFLDDGTVGTVDINTGADDSLLNAMWLRPEGV